MNQEAILDLWRASGLGQRIMFTLAVIVVFRLGVHIPLPGVDLYTLEQLFKQGNILMGFLDLFSGGALVKFSLFAMGITPYINASIIMQLMTAVIPKLEEMQKEEGMEGRRRINQMSRYLTVALSLVQSFALTNWLWRSGAVLGHPPHGAVPWMFFIHSIPVLMAGTIFIMWMGEQITERGLGNGASMLIFIGIIARIPTYMHNTSDLVENNGASWFAVGILLLVFFAMLVAIIYAQEGARKIPVQSAKRQVGKRIYGGQGTYIPLRVNQGGVMPIIFASSVLLFPATLHQFVGLTWLRTITDALMPSKPLYPILYFFLIVFFTFFYASIVLNPMDLANNLKKYGNFIPGYRPGVRTAEFLEKILTRITWIGAIFLGCIALIPTYVENWTGVTTLQGLGSTAILIMVGVAIDIFNQLQTHLIARQYEGLMR